MISMMGVGPASRATLLAPDQPLNNAETSADLG